MFRPLHGLVLILPYTQEKTTTGGLVLPDNLRDKILSGRVIAVGSGVPLEGGQRAKPLVEPGDSVLFLSEKDKAGNRNVVEIEDSGVKYWLINGQDILGIQEQSSLFGQTQTAVV